MSARSDPIRYYLTGPTGSGKKDIAVRLAERMNVELIAMDSMKVYRGLDIGTATPSEELCDQVPYHLINIRAPDESFSVAAYIEEVEQVEHRIRDRGNEPLFVGGTGMYLDRLLNGLFEGPEADWSLREELKKEAEEADEGSKVLYKRLAQVDPDRAEEIHPNDQRRIIRALEVYELTGRPMSEHLRDAQEDAGQYDHRVAVLNWDREYLYDRINKRVERMMESGWIEEARTLKNLELPSGADVLQAIGYSQIFDYLEGEVSKEEMMESIRTEHRNLARRQLTWFRNLGDQVQWVSPDQTASPEDVMEEVLHVFERTENKLS